MTMNEQQQLIVETSHRIFSDLCTKEVVDRGEAGEWAQALWHALETSGLTLAGIAEDAGGSGGDVADALLVIRQAAEFAAPIPLAENFIAATLLVEAGIELSLRKLTGITGKIGHCNCNTAGSCLNMSVCAYTTGVDDFTISKSRIAAIF